MVTGQEGLNRPLVYQIFQYLLSDTDDLNDQVVRITAGRQLASIIDPFEFTAEPFAPFASNILGRLIKLIGEVELTETKIALLTTISIIVTKMEHHVKETICIVIGIRLMANRLPHSPTKSFPHFPNVGPSR